MKLYSYWRSSAAYRVRIALGLKGINYSTAPINLASGDQRGDTYLHRNPQGLVPALELDDGTLLTQSGAILEWLEETHPDPALYPRDALARAHCRALCQHIACDIHPLNNLRVLAYLRDDLGQEQQAIAHWYAHWIQRGFSALEAAAAAQETRFSLGDRPGMFELMLVPQIYNARRFKVPLDAFPTLVARDAECALVPAFAAAAPGKQPDAPDNSCP
jgi:maleylacetoacetate isomerase